MQIVVGLPDALADHAEAVMNALGPRPTMLGGQVTRETEQTAVRVQRERHQHLVNQLNAELAEARRNGDNEATSELMGRYRDLMDRKREFVPRESPYFRDTRTPKKSG